MTHPIRFGLTAACGLSLAIVAPAAPAIAQDMWPPVVVWELEAPVQGQALRRHLRAERFIERWDADDSGAITQQEVDGLRQSLFRQNDADGDDSLSLEEYERLWLANRRAQLVRQFQGLDADGDGRVTMTEYQRPLRRMIAWFDRDGDGALDARDLTAWQRLSDRDQRRQDRAAERAERRAQRQEAHRHGQEMQQQVQQQTQGDDSGAADTGTGTTP